MHDPQSHLFARHVHEVVDLDAHGASHEVIEARVDAMQVDRAERSALWSLASSLNDGALTPATLIQTAPPAMAGRITSVSDAPTEVSRPSITRTSSSLR